MHDKQNQGPLCAACGSPMRLSVIEPSMWSRHLRTFACSPCNSSELHFIESAATETWQAAGGRKNR
jgi:hypothetical protein